MNQNKKCFNIPNDHYVTIGTLVNNNNIGRMIWNSTKNLNMKELDIPVVNVNLLPRSRVAWNGTRNLCMKGSNIPVTNVNIQDLDQHFIDTNNPNMKGLDIPVISVGMLPLSRVTWKSTKKLSMKGSDFPVISVNILQLS